MAGNEIGEAEIAVRASVKNFTSDVTSEIEGKAEKSGSRMGELLVGGLKTATGAAAAGIAVVLGTAFTKGFSRLSSIDQAEAKLKGLGITGEQLSGVMKNALDSVKGTAFGLDEAVSAIPGLLAAGVKPGQDLEQALKNMGSTATLAGTSFSEISDVFGDAAAAGGATTDTFNRMASRGIPALQMVADHMGITAEEAAKMASEGKISFATFQDALTESIGPAALEAGNSFQGMLANTMTALGRLGAAVLGPVFEGLKTVMPTLISAFDQIGAAITPLVEEIGPKVGEMFQSFADGIASVPWDKVVGAITNIAGVFIDWAPAILTVVGAFLALKTAIFVTSAIMKGFQAVMAVIKAFQLGMAAASYGLTGATYALAAANNALRIAQLLGAAASYVFSGALLTNPITWIVLAIVALIAALVLLIVNWDKVVKFITDVWSGFISWFTGVMDGFLSWWSGIWEAVVGFFKAAWEGIVAFFTPIFEVIATIIRVYIEIWINIFLILAAVLKVVWDFIAGIFTAAWEAIVAFVTPIVKAISDYIADVIRGLQIIWNAVWGAISGFFKGIWEAMVSFFKPHIDRIVSIISVAVAIVKGVWNSTWSAISSFFKGIWDGIVSAVRTAVDTVVSVVRGIKDKIMGALTGAATWLLGIGKDIIRGLIDGIRSMIDGVISAISDTVNGAIDWAKSILKSNSPSKVFDQIGQDLGQGFVNGVDKLASDVQAAVGNMTTGAVNVAGNIVSAVPAGAAAASGFPAVPTSSITTNNAPVVNVWGDMQPERTAVLVGNRIAERLAVA